MPTLDRSLPVINWTLAVNFIWNGSSGARYVRNNEDLTFLSQTYIAEPTFKFSMEKMHGGTPTQKATIELPLTRSPLAEMSKEEHAQVEVFVYEVDRTDTSKYSLMFAGSVAKVKRYSDGKAAIVSAELVDAKFWMNKVQLGIPCLPNCTAVFGDGITCLKSLASITYNADITDITGDQVTFSSLTNSSTSGAFQNGFIKYQGLSIRIRKHETSAIVWLDKVPPSSWDGQTVAVTEGCRRTPADCARHGQESRFLALGALMPKYDPRFQDPAGAA